MAFSGVHSTGSAAKQPQLQRPLQAIQDRLQTVPEAQDSDRLKLSEEILEDLLHSGMGMPNFEQLAQSLAADPTVESKATEKVGAAKGKMPERKTTVHWQPGHEPGKIIQPEGAIGIIGATIRETKDKKQPEGEPPKAPTQAAKAPQKPDRVQLSPESKQQMKDLRESGAEESASKIEKAAENPQNDSGKQEPGQETTVTEVPGQVAYTKFPNWNQTAWIKEGGSFESKPGKRTLIRAFQNVQDQPNHVLRKLEPMEGNKVRELARDNPIPELDKHQQKRLADPEMEFK